MVISADFCSSVAIFLEFYWKFDNNCIYFTHSLLQLCEHS